MFVLLTTINACSQSTKDKIENKLYGSWVLKSNYEFPDVIIFRSDHKYFVYNSNNVSPESLGLTENLKNGDILIDGSYTSMTEKGIWLYIPDTKKLILKERNILSEWTDFSAAYGKSKEIYFHLKELSENKLILCFDKKGEQACDEYEKHWSYITKSGIKVFYKEITNEYIGTGSQEKEILLSGYETELKLTYEFYEKADQLTIMDGTGKEIFSVKMISTNREKNEIIYLQGVTKLVFKVTSDKADSKWKIKIDIK